MIDRAGDRAVAASTTASPGAYAAGQLDMRRRHIFSPEVRGGKQSWGRQSTVPVPLELMGQQQAERLCRTREPSREQRAGDSGTVSPRRWSLGSIFTNLEKSSEAERLACALHPGLERQLSMATAMSTLVHPAHLSYNGRFWPIGAGNLAPQTKAASYSTKYVESRLTTCRPTLLRSGRQSIDSHWYRTIAKCFRRVGQATQSPQRCTFGFRSVISRLVPAFSEFASALLTRPAFPRTFESSPLALERVRSHCSADAASKSIAFGGCQSIGLVYIACQSWCLVHLAASTQTTAGATKQAAAQEERYAVPANVPSPTGAARCCMQLRTDARCVMGIDGLAPSDPSFFRIGINLLCIDF
ncbi:hypothetical protein BV20DRAFT_979603 [Pilatotrama ljubarskyi]|nr:hypothetical protein BV20DRAFT_979603 [Pilatotrama ljubarskyi]